MTLRASRLRKLENPNLSVNSRAELACELAREFENKGEYESARKALSHYWHRIGEHPKVTGLEPSTAGEVLLRAGVLTGAIGNRSQIADAQEKAKDLISESLTIFQSSNYRKKIAEAQMELALCYWRSGEAENARALLVEALLRLTVDSELKGRAILRLGIVEIEASDYKKALDILTEHASLFEKINTQIVKGSYYVTLGNVLEKLWETDRRTEYLDRALVEYAAASYHFEEAEHRCYLANTEANLGLLYLTINQCEDAHKHLDHARRVLTSLNDINGVAQVDETRACVFLKQGRFEEAERVARSAVRAHEKGGSQPLAAEALITHGRALARLGHYGASLSAFRRSIELSEHTGSLNRAAEAALAAFQEMGEHLVVVEGRTLVSGRKMGQEKQLFEHEAIKLALINAQGSISRAARILGIKHQTLAYMLNTRHKDLLKYRKPIYRRTRK